MEIRPPLPAVAVLLPIEIEPEEPELDVPELNAKIPLAPLSPAFKVLTNTEPLELDDVYPLCMITAPEVLPWLMPATMEINPPAPLLPSPTVILIIPPDASPAVSEPIEIEPDDPELDVPELNASAPVEPCVPASAVEILI
jgi:hypothetical protein